MSRQFYKTAFTKDFSEKAFFRSEGRICGNEAFGTAVMTFVKPGSFRVMTTFTRKF